MAWPVGGKLVEAAGLAARAVAGAATFRAGAHLRVEGRRLFASDAVVCRTVAGVARLTAPAAALSLEPHADGYLARATYAGRPIAAVLRLESVRLEGGRLAAVLATPRGVELRGRPVAAFLARVVRRLLGGTAAARVLLGLATPDALAWDGRRARVVARVEGVPFVGARLAALAAAATATRREGGLWLEFDRDGVAQDVLGLLLASAVDGVAAGLGVPGAR